VKAIAVTIVARNKPTITNPPCFISKIGALASIAGLPAGTAKLIINAGITKFTTEGTNRLKKGPKFKNTFLPNHQCGYIAKGTERRPRISRHNNINARQTNEFRLVLCQLP